MLSVRVRLARGAFALDVAFEAATPGVVALIGASGCGKTTTLDAIAGLVAPERGRIALGDRVLFEAGATNVPPERRRIGYVFQDARLFPHRSVRGNLLYGAHRAPAGARAHALDDVVALLGLAELLARRPHQLSGGERKRVAIGRALLAQPLLLLLDEPLASLDPARRAELLPYLERLRDALRLPIVYVSHQLDEVQRLASHVVLLADGRVAAQGDALAIARDPALGALLGPEAAGVVVAGRVLAVAQGVATLRVGHGELRLALAARVGDVLALRVRARDVLVAAQEPVGLAQASVLRGEVTSVDAESPLTCLVELDVGGERLLARASAERVAALGLAPGRAAWAVVGDASRWGADPPA